MKDSAYKISLDINGNGSQLVLNARHMDTGRKLYVSLRSGGDPYIIEKNCYAAFVAAKPDGTDLYNACDIEGNEIVYEFTEQTCSVIGRSRCEIILYGPDDKAITSPRFALLVDGTICPEGKVVSTDEFTALTHATSVAIEATGSANDAAAKANTAATDALGAARIASDATVVADGAAKAAITAAQNANTATGAANQAASAATQSAQYANTAAAEARRSGEDADDAAASANQAAQSANSASINANQAATKAAQTAKSLMVVGKAEGTSIYLDDAIEQFLVGCRIFGKTTQDGVPTPDAPVDLVSVGDSGSVGVTVSSKNLAQVLYAQSLTTRYASIVNIKPIKLLKGVTYSVSFDTENTGVYCYINSKAFSYYRFIQDGTRKSFVFTYTEDKMMDVEPDGSTILVSRDSETSDVASGLISNVQIEVSGSTTEYEPYKGQSITMSTPNGLPGIPVTSGGNYTDANGQQWICDEIDFARGVYVQRINVLDPTEVIRSYNNAAGTNRVVVVCDDAAHAEGRDIGAVMCNLLPTMSANDQYSTNESSISIAYSNVAITIKDETTEDAVTQWLNNNPMEIQYALATPVETALSKEELAAYAALHTYRGNTTVSNDASAHMEIEYVMDAKKYIDRQLAGSILTATVE